MLGFQLVQAWGDAGRPLQTSQSLSTSSMMDAQLENNAYILFQISVVISKHLDMSMCANNVHGTFYTYFLDLQYIVYNTYTVLILYILHSAIYIIKCTYPCTRRPQRTACLTALFPIALSPEPSMAPSKLKFLHQTTRSPAACDSPRVQTEKFGTRSLYLIS